MKVCHRSPQRAATSVHARTALSFVTFARAVRGQAPDSRNDRIAHSPVSRSLRRCAPTRGAVAVGTALLFLAGIALGNAPLSPGSPGVGGSDAVAAAGMPAIRTVNAPHFAAAPVAGQAAVFWFGAVTPTNTYSDVRVGYTDTELYVYVSTVDRLLWYNTANPQSDLTAWDADTLYLGLGGPAGAAPDARSYRFDAALNSSSAGSPAAYQASYRGDGSGWVTAPVAFATQPGWRGLLNTTQDSKGWAMTYHIPFASLGLAGPPAAGSAWALGLVNHNRDSAAGPPVGDTPWPEGLAAGVPGSWGRLLFGLPSYQPPATTNNRTITLQNRLNGLAVPDAGVGGYTTCGGALDYWSQWGSANYAGGTDFNVQDESDISDYPCFAKYYVTFPLGSLPSGQAIATATLTLHEFGGSGGPGQATPSLIQVSTVREDWSEASITWNNAPYALENVSEATVDPLATQPPWPGVARSWDLSRAVADAYASGQPLRLAVYSADTDYHSGKYFVSSDTGDWNAAGRPALSITVGTPAGGSPTATASPTATNTATPIPPTATATVLPTRTPATSPTVAPTATHAPTNTPIRPTASPTVAPTVAPTPTGTPAAGPTVLVGSNAMGDTQDYVVPGTANAFQVTAAGAGTLNTVAIYLDRTNTATTIVLGMYSDNGGQPGTLLTQGTIAAPTSGAWNRVAVPPVTLAAGRSYWLVILAPQGKGTIQFRDSGTGGAAIVSYQTTLTSLPATWQSGERYPGSPPTAYGASG